MGTGNLVGTRVNPKWVKIPDGAHFIFNGENKLTHAGSRCLALTFGTTVYKKVFIDSSLTYILPFLHRSIFFCLLACPCVSVSIFVWYGRVSGLVICVCLSSTRGLSLFVSLYARMSVYLSVSLSL